MARARTLSDLGERRLIDRIARAAGRLDQSGVVLGIGDDAAILRPRQGEDLVASTDASIENVHFRFSYQSPAHVGRRALLANLSDLAAMGARPLGFSLALAAPADLELARFDGLVRGLLMEAERHRCPLVGGNLARASQTSLVIHVYGGVPRGRALRRDALRPGDRLFVTGQLGAAGLARAAAERTGRPIRQLPAARLAAGRALLGLAGRGACIDLSDGLLADLGHLLEGRGLGAELDGERLPMPRGFTRRCRELALDPMALALSGGEDYELLFSLRPRAARQHTLAQLTRRLGAPVSAIGRVFRGRGIRGVPDSPGFLHY
ncbi:MAG: thiamine-phosphate kinase [Myxococcota bacterium]|nr:thiamine-phosphate kinase [Myxococcota bacterium]